MLGHLTRHKSAVRKAANHKRNAIYYGFGLGLDTRDSNAYVSRAKRTRCYTETATFPRANFLERK